jgi:two-component system, NtrC family, sensor histidine kinase HydH
MELGVRATAEGSLARRLSWLTALRLVVLTTFLVGTSTIYLGGFTLGGFSSLFALVTVGIAYGLAAIYAVMLRAGRALATVARVQLVTDQITWTALVYITGGAQSGATSLYGLTCLSGAILLGVRGGVLAALSSGAAFLMLCAGFALGIVGPPVDQPSEAYLTHGTEMGYAIFVNLLALGVVTLLASYLAERLRTTGGHLEVATARAEQAERLAALGRLAAGLAHEIRNPLGSIAGSIELLRTGGTLSAEDQKLCEIVERETARLNDLVGDMLDLSRPRAPAKAPVDLVSIARDVVVLAARSGRGSDVSAHYEGPDAAIAFADAAQMRQVVWNLVRNAIQASSAGDEVLVRISEGVRGEHLLEVCDRGPGIPPETRERLFDAFFTTRAHGMGIGLAVVKRILDDHGFAVEVDSGGGQAGQGTTIRVRIPGFDGAEGRPSMSSLQTSP